MTDCGVYRITCVPSGRVYIGSSVSISKRFSEHRSGLRYGRHHSYMLQRAWDKHGAENFKFETLLRCSADMRIEYEQACIDAYESANPRFGMNVCVEARGAPPKAAFRGRKHTPETKRLLSERLKGRAVWNKGVPSTKKGIKRSPEVCARIAAAKRAGRGTKINIEIARAIRAAHAAGGITQKAVALKFGIPYELTSRVIRNAAWVEIL